MDSACFVKEWVPYCQAGTKTAGVSWAAISPCVHVRRARPHSSGFQPLGSSSKGKCAEVLLLAIFPQRCLLWLLFPLKNWTCLHQESDQISRSVVSNSLRPHESQHARPPCPSPTPGVHSDSRPSTQWCHPGISSSVVPFSSCPQSLPASQSFPVSQLFAWGGQSTGVSASASFRPKKSQNGLVGSSCSPRDSKESSPTPQFKSIPSQETINGEISTPSSPFMSVIAYTWRLSVGQGGLSTTNHCKEWLRVRKRFKEIYCSQSC